jgi:hypothetical protein
LASAERRVPGDRGLVEFRQRLPAADKPLDWRTVNSWEDIEFVQAVHAPGRRKLIFCALWTEVRMAFGALDALRDGYHLSPVVDGWVSLARELQRESARIETAAANY